jgi:hypothetical protein
MNLIQLWTYAAEHSVLMALRESFPLPLSLGLEEFEALVLEEAN